MERQRDRVLYEVNSTADDRKKARERGKNTEWKKGKNSIDRDVIEHGSSGRLNGCSGTRNAAPLITALRAEKDDIPLPFTIYSQWWLKIEI